MKDLFLAGLEAIGFFAAVVLVTMLLVRLGVWVFSQGGV